jgi:hypothetical protein
LKNFLLALALTVTPVLADENPFTPIRERDQWAIEALMEHREPSSAAVGYEGNKKPMKKAKAAATVTVPFQTKTYAFQTETDVAKVNVTVTSMEGDFIIDVSTDQTIQGWMLKRQSTRQVFLKGGPPNDNPYETRIRVERPYIADFGLTVFVTQDSDPAFVRLF